MCSISGFICEKRLSPDETLRLVSALLHHGMSRGEQSAGVWLDGQLLKFAKSPQVLRMSVEFEELCAKGASWGLVHTRQPTSGGRDNEHAQPFHTNQTVTVHNGVIHNEKWLKDKWGLVPTTDVDSELVTAFVDKHGPDKLPDFMRDITGSAAIAVVHGTKMYLARKSNPLEYLSFLRPDKSDITVFGSTEEILGASLDYTWLMPTGMRTKLLTEGRVHEVTPKLMIQRGESFSYAYGRGYGVHDGYGGMNDYTDSHWDKKTNSWKKNHGPTLSKTVVERIQDLESEMKDLKNTVKQKKRMSKDDISKICEVLEEKGAIVLKVEPGVTGKDLQDIMEAFPDSDVPPEARPPVKLLPRMPERSKANGHDNHPTD